MPEWQVLFNIGSAPEEARLHHEGIVRRQNTSSRIVFIVILSAALMYSNPPLPKAAVSPPPAPESCFLIGEKPFRFMGGLVPGWHFGLENIDNDDNLMQTARDGGITVLFTWIPEFEKTLGVYTESELVRLDKFIDSASRSGIYVMPSFIQAYSDTLQPDNPYYHKRSIEGIIKVTDLRQAFKNRMAKLIKRRNTVNGRKYKEDPTIMGWILCIEPISAPGNYKNGLPRVSLAQMTGWFEESASFIRSLDPNHLVTVQIHPAFQEFFGGGGEFLSAVNIPQFDFIYSEDADQRIVRNEPDNDYCLRLFGSGRPVVFSPAFTSGLWNRESLCKDYSTQASWLDESTRAYFQAGSAGVLIQNWVSEQEWIPDFDQCYSYNKSNLVMYQCFSTLGTWINPARLPGMPLQFVKCDSDSDGMPDRWEVTYGLNPLVNDAALDKDGDGFSNLVEYRKGTNPDDSRSRPGAGLPWLGVLLD